MTDIHSIKFAPLQKNQSIPIHQYNTVMSLHCPICYHTAI